MKVVLVRVRCGCRRIMAEVGRDVDTPPGSLVIALKGREPDEDIPWHETSRWRPTSHVETVEDPRQRDGGTGPTTPLTCDKCRSSRPFLFHGELRGKLTEAEAKGRPVDVTL